MDALGPETLIAATGERDNVEQETTRVRKKERGEREIEREREREGGAEKDRRKKRRADR